MWGLRRLNAIYEKQTNKNHWNFRKEGEVYSRLRFLDTSFSYKPHYYITTNNVCCYDLDFIEKENIA